MVPGGLARIPPATNIDGRANASPILLSASPPSAGGPALKFPERLPISSWRPIVPVIGSGKALQGTEVDAQREEDGWRLTPRDTNDGKARHTYGVAVDQSGSCLFDGYRMRNRAGSLSERDLCQR